MTGHRSLLPYAPVALAALCLAATPATAQNSGTVSITSTPGLKSALGVMPEVRYYSAGETITVRITPTGGARVGSFRAYHNPNIDDEDTTFTLNVGDVKRTVSRNYYSGESGGYAEFRYTVVAADRDTNGVSVDANAFGGNVYLATGGAGSSPRLTNGALADQSGHVVRGAQTVPAFAQGSISFTFDTGAAVSVELPRVTGGEGGLTYALAAGSTLPTGLVYTPPGSTDTHGGAISGTTPATSQASTSYSVTVTDGDGDSDTLTVNIALGNRNTFKADNAYAVSPASLSARTSSQSLGVAGFPSWTGRSVHACRRQLTLRTTPVGASECRQVAVGASPTAVTLSQAEIDNGGIVVVVWDGAGVVLAQWVAVLPVAPGSFTATPAVGEVALGWDDPGNASISHYEARHRRSGGSWGAWTEIAASDQDTTAHEVTGLDAGTAYEFEVRAVNTGGDGAAASVTATAPGLVFSAASTTVPEGGSGAYTAALASRPSAAVTVRVTSDNADVDTSPGTLAFTRDNWSAAQTVTVRATADDDGADDTATLAHRAAGGDYDTLAATHSVTVTDPETQGVSISPTTLRVPEGRSATYRMELDTEPTGAVTVTVSRTGSAGVTFEPASLTFNAANWVRAQAVTVTAATDANMADETATLAHAVAGADYASVAAATVSVTAVDGDVPGLVFEPLSLEVVEGASRTYRASLTTQPTGAVTVSITGGTGVVGVTPPSLTFDAATWSTARTVTVQGTADDDAADETATLAHAASGGGYGSVNADYAVRVIDDERAPPVPLNLSARAAGNGGVALTWERTTDRTVTKYQGSRRQRQSGTWSAWSDWTDLAGSDWRTVSHTFTGLTADTRYGFRIRAVNDAGAGAAAETEGVAGRVRNGSNYPGLTVTLPSPLEPVASSRQVLRLDYTGSITGHRFGVYECGATAITTSTTTDAAGCTNQLYFEPRIRSGPISVPITFTVTQAMIDGGGFYLGVIDSNSSNDFRSVSWIPILPAAPSSLTAAGGNSQVALGWTDPGNDSISHYEVRSRPADGRWSGWTKITGSDKDTTGHTATGLDPGVTYAFEVRAANLNGHGAAAAASATTNNQPPTADAGTDQMVDEGDAVTLDGSASSDPERQPLTYAWTQTAGTLVSLSATTVSMPTFTAPDLVANETLTFSLTVNDGAQDSTADTVTVTVRADNDAPTADAGTDQTVDEGDTVTLDGSASTDPESQSLTYAWTQTAGTTVSLSSSSAAEPTFTAPDLAANATLTFSLTVNDGAQDSTADTVTITVRADNDAPTADAGTDQTVSDGTLVTLDGSGSTDDGGSGGLTYAWTQTAGTTVTLSSATAASPTFTAPELVANETLTFSLTVNDGSLGSAADTVDVTVTAEDDAPTADAGTDQTVDEGDTVTLDGSASSDPESQPLTYAWTQTAGTTVTLSSATDQGPTFVAPTGLAEDETLTFSLTVNDGAQDSAADTVDVTVREGKRLLLDPDTLRVDEEGSATYTVTLSTQPTGAVTVAVARSAGSPDVTVLPAALTFTTGSWNRAQAVTVTAAADNDSAAETATIGHTATGGDYQGLTADLAVSVADNDAAGLRLEDTGDTPSTLNTLTVTENASASYTVRLFTPPSPGAQVTVALAVTGSPDVTVTPTPLTFTDSDWSTVQTVTVRAAHDDDASPDAATIAHTATGGGYVSITADLAVSVSEDDTPALALDPARLDVDEGGSATYTVRLATLPTTAVTVAVARSAGSPDVTVLPSSLTFAPAEWSTAQTVTVRASEDDTDVTDDAATIGHTASGGDYQGLTADLAVSVSDNDATADVNGDGAVNANDGLLMYYAYTFETVFKLENDLGQRVRGFLRTLRGPTSPAADDAGYKAMLQAAWDWRSAGTTAGDVNGDGSISPNDGLLMYYAYTFEAVFKLENDLGRRVRGFLRTLRSPTSSHPATDAGYKAMLNAAWGLR